MRYHHRLTLARVLLGENIISSKMLISTFLLGGTKMQVFRRCKLSL